MAHCFVGLPKTKSGKVSKTSLYEMKPNNKMVSIPAGTMG